MANINLSGVLRDPLGEVSYGNTVKFTHETTTGETIGGFASALIVEINGAYDIDLEYGNVLIESYDKINSRWIKHGTFTINSETPANSLPSLIGITTPLSDEQLLIVQNLVADAEAAKNEAQTAQSNTEALFNDFDSSIADSLSDIGSNIAFEAAFNDSNAIQRGYGTHDVIDVSAAQDGSIEVELPTKSIDFSCASERTVINKSDVLEAVGVDKPAIGEDGVWMHGAYTNFAFPSEGVVGGSNSWGINNAENVLENTTGHTSTLGDNAGYISTEGAIGAGIFKSSLYTGDDEYVTVSAWMKGAVGGETVAIGASDRVAFTLSAEWELYSTIVATGAGSLTMFTASAASQDWYYDGFSLIEGTNYLPYIKTESTTVSVAKTVASIPAMNNLPSAGQPFAIEVDCYMHSSTNESVVFRQARSTSTGLFLRRQSSGLIQFGIAADGITKTADYSGDYGKHKYVCKYDGVGNMYLYEDGSQVAANTTNTPTYDLNVALNIGNDSSYNLNGQLKNFRIHHGDVSADTIKSWGGAK